MKSFLKLNLLLAAILLPGTIWGDDGSSSDSLSERWAAFFATTNQQPGPMAKLPSATPFEATFSPTYFAPPPASNRLRDLTPETDRPRTEGFLMSTKWMKGLLVTEAEVANSAGGSGSLANRAAGDAREDSSNRMVRMGLTGTSGAMRYGVTYRNAGQSFLNIPDQSLREIWGEWKQGFTTLRTQIGQAWNNVAGDSSRSRLEQTYGRIGMAWAKPAWPALSLTYARSSLSSALDPLGITPQQTENHAVEAAITYSRPQWNVRLATNYFLTSDLMRNGAETDTRLQLLTASFRPLNTFTIQPTLAYRQDVQSWSGVRTESPSGSLAMHYRQSRQLLVSAVGNYASTRSSDGLTDTENVSGKGTLAWNLRSTVTWTTLLAVEAGYSRVTNRIVPAADTEDISGVVKLVLAAL